ncbi:hypothetical protein C4587_00915 [Candidatus Parcubacteria bacterium]|nr:MAG: hypothetical protein C4587_00915 [Candidatus Parcubacteria bacterium]
MTRKPFKQAEGSDDPSARRLQKRLRLAIAQFAEAQIDGDDLMVLSVIMTECAAETFELLNRYNYAPTEEQFVGLWAAVAGIVARGEHVVGIENEGGSA